MENKDMKIGLVIMASGLGKRFGGNKLMADLKGKPMLQWILDTTEGLFEKRVVVTRNKEVENLCKQLHIDCIYHEFPGRNDTVRLGLSALRADVDYCFFTPGDQPLIRQASIQKLMAAALENRERIVRAGFLEKVGSPMGFPAEFFEQLCNLPEGKGGNFVALKNPEVVYPIMIEDEYELFDVDTVEDLEIVKGRL